MCVDSSSGRFPTRSLHVSVPGKENKETEFHIYMQSETYIATCLPPLQKHVLVVVIVVVVVFVVNIHVRMREPEKFCEMIREYDAEHISL